MSVTSVVVVVEAVVLLLLVVFVVALLRSHAEILRRLAGLETGTGSTSSRPSASTSPTPSTSPYPSPSTIAAFPSGLPPALIGQTPTGDAVKLALGPDSPRTLLAFLSSGCTACGPLWQELHRGSPAPSDTRVVVVTKGTDQESSGRLKKLAPAGAEVVMSTQAFEEFAVPVTPHFILLDPGGTLAGRGSAGSWQQILTLLGDADADRGAKLDSSARAARAEDALRVAGVTPGHPSLYPSRHSGPSE